MVGLPSSKIRLGLITAAVVLSSSPAWAGYASDGTPVWLWPAIGITGLLLIIWALSRFIRNDPYLEAQMRREAGDTHNIIPLPGDDGGHHFH